MIKRLANDALIRPILKEFDFNTEGDALRKRFEEDYQKELQQLWEFFLHDVAVERAIQDNPKLLTKLEDTPLSSRAKKCLEAMDVKDVVGIAIYSPRELGTFRGMGKTTLEEIEDYVKVVIGTK